MKSGTSLAGTVLGIILMACTLIVAGCASPPPPRVPGTPDPGVLHRDARQDIKLRVGKPGDPVVEDATENYEKRDDGLLENKAIGVKGIWKF